MTPEAGVFFRTSIAMCDTQGAMLMMLVVALLDFAQSLAMPHEAIPAFGSIQRSRTSRR